MQGLVGGHLLGRGAEGLGSGEAVLAGVLEVLRHAGQLLGEGVDDAVEAELLNVRDGPSPCYCLESGVRDHPVAVTTPGETLTALPIHHFAGRHFTRCQQVAVMTSFETRRLPLTPDVVAPDGSGVRILLGLSGGGLAHFELPPDQVSIAVTHRTVEEIWFFLSGRGEMWRQQEGREEIVAVEPGVCLTIPLGTHFQFRSFGPEPLAALGVTMPPWPGDGEAMVVRGRWQPTLPSTGEPDF